MPAESATEEELSARSGAAAYREFLADREDLLKHKWILSEQAGHDIGLEAALLSWMGPVRTAMRKQRGK